MLSSCPFSTERMNKVFVFCRTEHCFNETHEINQNLLPKFPEISNHTEKEKQLLASGVKAFANSIFLWTYV